MTILQSIILGIVQGVTEFLPVSSSGHLILIPTLFGWDLQDLSFDVALHIGTALAVLLFFWKDWYNMLSSFYLDVRKQFLSRDFGVSKLRRETKMLLTIIIVSIPVGIAGLFLESTIEEMFRSSLFVAVMLILVSFIMFAADRFAKVNYDKLEPDLFNIPFVKALIISLSQILALFPGTSRSGISISTALFNKIDYKQSARFSFLLATPLILGAGLVKLPDIANSSVELVPLIVGFITSFVTGILAIKFFLEFLRKQGLMIFIVYRIALGIIILVL